MRLWKSGGRTWTLWAGLSEKCPKTAKPFTSQRHHEKGADFVGQRASGPASARRQTPQRHHNPVMVKGKAAGMGRYSPGHDADAHVSNTTMETGAAASLAATNKTNEYSQLSATHIFTPMHIESAGTWHHQAVELVQELGRRASIITGDSRETTYTCSRCSQWLCKR